MTSWVSQRRLILMLLGILSGIINICTSTSAHQHLHTVPLLLLVDVDLGPASILAALRSRSTQWLPLASCNPFLENLCYTKTLNSCPDPAYTFLGQQGCAIFAFQSLRTCPEKPFLQERSKLSRSADGMDVSWAGMFADSDFLGTLWQCMSWSKREASSQCFHFSVCTLTGPPFPTFF